MSSKANVLSDCIADALDRCLCEVLNDSIYVTYVECDNLPLDLLARDCDKYRFISRYNKFLYNIKQLYHETKTDASKDGLKKSRRVCRINYEIDNNILKVGITPRFFSYSKEEGYISELSDWYIYNYIYDFEEKQWIFSSQDSGGI